MHNVSKWTDEFMACKEFHFHMRQLNNEQKTIVDDILYKKTKNPTKLFHIFLTWNVSTTNFFSHLNYTKHIMILQMLTL
jgi:hypothetical protein